MLEDKLNKILRRTVASGLITLGAAFSANAQTLPEQTIVSPMNGSLVAYDNQNRFEIDTDPDDATDSNGKRLWKRAKFYNEYTNALELDTAIFNEEKLYIKKGRLKGWVRYRVKTILSNGELATPEVSVAFTTPNSMMPFSFVSPKDDQIIEYDSKREIEIVTEPNLNTHYYEGQYLAKQIKITGPGLDTLITEFTMTRIYLKESRLTPGSEYTMEGFIFAGAQRSPIVTTTFKTPEKIVVGVDNDNDSDTNYKAKRLEVYPNPTSDNINLKIQSQVPLKYNVEMYSIEGKLLDKDTKANFSNEYEKQYDMSNLSKGLYILKINTQDDKGKTYLDVKKTVKH